MIETLDLGRMLDLAVPLRADGLHKRYGKQEVLRGVNLQLRQGEVLGLIGRNGAGKSTLLACLLGLTRPDAGTASVFGQAALRMDDDAKARLGYVPQQPQAFGWLTVAELMRYLRQLYPVWDAGFVAALLKRWEVPVDKPIAKLSPGQAQRAAIVRALAPQPSLLVLDEPASALDPVARRELLRELALQAGESGTTVLFSSHIVSDLERVASRVALLHEGRLLLDTDIDAAREGIARLWLPDGAALPAHALPGELARHRHDNGSVTLVLTRDSEAWARLATRAEARIDPLGLEDLFVEIAG